MAASEAISVPRFVLVCHTAAGDNLITLHTSSSEFVFVTSSAIDLLFTWNKTFCTNRILADYAAETFLMPLTCFVFHFLSASTEDFSAAIAATSELGIVAVAAVDLVYLATELFIYQGHPAFVAEETRFMPVLVLVRQILGVNTDKFVTLLTSVSKYTLVALDAVRVFVSQDISLTC